MTLDRRLELESSGRLQGSFLLMEPNAGGASHASASASSSREVIQESLIVDTVSAMMVSRALSSSTELAVDQSIVRNDGDEAGADDPEGSQSDRSSRGRSGRDFQLV